MAKPRTFEEKAQILAALADRLGMWCHDVVRFPDLWRGSCLKKNDLTPALVGHAEGINRDAFHRSVDRYATKEDLINQQTRLFGLSISSVVRWMAANEWEYSDVKRVLSHLERDCSSTTIHAQIGKGQQGQQIPELTDEQENELWDALELTS